jgi:hypothetical protein|tara:strand:+ start:459 stop:692 length:234 start_codon:yes stop_codon:yes gene_type:complete
MEIQKGTLLRNKSDKSYAIVIQEPAVRFFPDANHRYGEFESGVADTAIRIKWVQNGYEHTLQRSKMSANWEVVNEDR